MLNLSVVIITLNEQENLKRCLSSLPKGCEIIVVDSGSTDKTIDVATSFGAKIYERAFDDFASQKNFAISKAKRSWVLSIDADDEKKTVESLFLAKDKLFLSSVTKSNSVSPKKVSEFLP